MIFNEAKRSERMVPIISNKELDDDLLEYVVKTSIVETYVIHCDAQVINGINRNFVLNTCGIIRRMAFLFNTRRGNVRVVDVAQDLIGFENADIWCVDPVHPIDQVYRRIASGVLKMAANQHEHDEATSGKRRRPEGGEGDDAQRRRPAEPQRWNWQGHEDERGYNRRNWQEDRGREEEQGYNRRPREFQNSRSGREEYEEGPIQGRGGYSNRGTRGPYHKRGNNRGWRRPY
jgi:hypothetical protein